MRDERKTKAQLIEELAELRCRMTQLEGGAALEEPSAENAYVDRADQHQTEVQALLAGARAVLRFYDSFENAARTIFDTCKDLIGATAGYVALLTDDGAENEVLFLEAGGLPCTVDPELPMPIRGLRSEAYRTGQAVYDNDFANSEWMQFMPEGHVALANVMFAPLNIDGKTVGLMGLSNKATGFTDNDARLATAFGQLAAIALRNSRTMELMRSGAEQYRQLLSRQESLLRINRAVQEMQRPGDLERVARVLYEEMRELGIDFQVLSIHRVLDEDRREFESCVVTPSSEVSVERGVRKNIYRMWQEGETVYRPDLIADPGGITPDGLASLRRFVGSGDICCILDVPHARGTFAIAGTRASAFTEHDVETVEQIADVLSVGISRAEDMEKLEARTKELQESEVRLRGAQELAAVGSWDWNLKTGELYWSDPVFRMYGYEPGEREPSFDLAWEPIHEDDKPHVGRAVEGAQKHGKPYEIEYRVIQPSGQVCHVHAVGRPEKNGSGQVVRVMGSAQDITARKQAEEALGKSQQLYRGAIECSGAVPYFRNYVANRFDFIGEGVEQMLGYKPEEFTPQIWESLVLERAHERHGDGKEGRKVVGDGTSDLGDTWWGEIRVRTRTGEDRWLENTATHINESDGETVGDLGILRDITDRKSLEQDLIRLERLRALGEMSAGVSHNLNNILTNILGPAQLLERMTDDPDLRREVEDIIRSTGRARDLVHRLHLSTRGIAEEKLEAVQVNETIREAVDIVRPRWRDEPEARGIAIELETKLDDVPPIRGSKSGFHDLVVNLILNAVDAMPEGGTISLRTLGTPEGVLISAKDTGVGMDDETRRRVFEPFFTTKMDVGSGLGLSTAYNTVARWGGDITVDSTQGEGTIFSIWLPAWTEGDAREKPSRQTRRKSVRAGRLLLVEDDLDVCSFLSRLFDGTHEVEMVSDGKETLEHFDPGRYDVALIDLGVPGLSGDKVAQRIRESDPHIATVLITGWELQEDDPRASVFDFRVQKPFDDLDELEDAVAQAMALHDERASP